MAAIYRAYNGPQPTTAAQQKVTTGTAIKTMLQLLSKSGVDMKIKAWGISFDGSAAATPGQVELVTTGTVAGTVTAYASGDIVRVSNPAGPLPETALITLGTSSSGYTCTSEGSVVATRELDVQLIAPTNQYIYQWPLGTEPLWVQQDVLRIRVTFGAAISATCWVDFEG